MLFDGRMARATFRLNLTRSGIASQIVTKRAKRWNGDTLYNPNEFGVIVGANCPSAPVELMIFGVVEKVTTTNTTNVYVIGCILEKLLHDDLF